MSDTNNSKSELTKKKEIFEEIIEGTPISAVDKYWSVDSNTAWWDYDTQIILFGSKEQKHLIIVDGDYIVQLKTIFDTTTTDNMELVNNAGYMGEEEPILESVLEDFVDGEKYNNNSDVKIQFNEDGFELLVPHNTEGSFLVVQFYF